MGVIENGTNTKIKRISITRGETRRRRRQQERQCQALSAGITTPAQTLAARGSHKRMLDGNTADGTVREEELQGHPLGNFEDVLVAIDDFLGVGARNETAGVATRRDPNPSPIGSEYFSTTSKNSRTDLKTVSRTRHKSFNETTKGERGKLSRLHTPSSAIDGGDQNTRNVGRNARAGTRSGSSQRSSETLLISAPATSTHNEPCRWQGKLCIDTLDDDPLDLVLRCRGYHRPGAHKRAAGFNNAESRPPVSPDPEAGRHSTFALKGKTNEVHDAADGVPASAGVFRLSHPGYGFVHYGYTWNITRAKAHQLRLLRGEDDTREVHPHHGLATVVRGQHRTGRRSIDREIRFEVVHLVPLPTQFRASEFDHTLREACAEEVVARRSWLLVLIARHFQRRHLSSAFQQILAMCRCMIAFEATSAASEIQRTWRGYLGRVLARLERDWQARERMRVVAATWTQARHRGRQGRLRVAQVQNCGDLAAAADEVLSRRLTAATRVQRWLRRSFQRRLGTITEKDDDAAVSNNMVASTKVDGKTPLEDGTEIEIMNGGVRGLTRPCSVSEVRVAWDLSSSDERVSLQSPRPLSSQDATGYNSLFPPLFEDTPESLSMTERKRHLRPPREVSGTKIHEAADGTMMGPLNAVDPFQLFLERNALSTSAMAIQAAWRGFLIRLETRKRKRAVAALRKKRESKWRQQRGVVGKQVAVGWDDRRELEEGMSRHEDGADKGVRSPCVDIQRLWRGALSRTRSRVVRERQNDEREASVQIQCVFRGAKGRWHARKQEVVQSSRTEAAYVLTQHARRFVRRRGTRQRRRDRCATEIQRAMHGFAARRDARRRRVYRRENAAADKVQSAARQWLSGRQAQWRTSLPTTGACALCFKRLADVFFETTEQELCRECYERTCILLADRGIALVRSEGVFEISVHRKRDRSAAIIQRVWLRAQRRACEKYGTCDACTDREGGIDVRPRAAETVCLAGCDHRRHLKYCRRCCAIVHSVRATAGHEIRSMDRYGAHMAAMAKLSSAMWRYNLKRRFWKIFTAYRKTLNSRTTLIQSRWRCYRCRSVFSAFSRAFLYLEAAAKSVERPWQITSSKDAVIPVIARFLAHRVDSSPPGIYPIPSGHKAVWEINIMRALRCRAAEKIKQRWKERTLRIEARFLADTVRLTMVGHQRLRTSEELQAAVDIERTWQGYRGRCRARHRAVIIAFARETVECYTNPSVFAIANLRAFNAHGGFLGSARIDARFLLAVATGYGVPHSACFRPRRSERSSAAKPTNGRGEMSLRLIRSKEDWCLTKALAGITELTLRVCLRQCEAESGSSRMLARQSQVTVTTIKAPATLLAPENQRGLERVCGKSSLSQNECDCRPDGLVDEDEPPLTLKLELISVQNPHEVSTNTLSSSPLQREKDFSGSEGDDHRLSDRRRCKHFGGRNSFSVSRTNETGDSAVETTDTNDSTILTSDTYGDSRANTRTCTDPEVTKSNNISDLEASENSDSETRSGMSTGNSASGTGMGNATGSMLQESQATFGSSTTTTTTTTTTTLTSSFVVSGDKDVDRKSWNKELRDVQYQCEVSWCGRSVGGTRAPLGGHPIHRWEGQVFYLPLCEAGSHVGTASMPAATTAVVSRALGPGGNLGDGESLSCETGKRHTNDKDTLRSFPPLLAITLNKLGKTFIWGHDKQYKRQSAWLRFILGLEEPVTVGRTVLEAGDVLGMLGSQQLVNIPAVSKPNLVDHGVSGKQDSEGKEDSAVERCGWQLRLLLSLEGRERTRTRLMVEEIVISLITEIVDLVPGRVARIELRVLGTRPLHTDVLLSSSSRVQKGRPPQNADLFVSVEWNGEHAGGVELPPGDDQAIESSTKNSLATHDEGFQQAHNEYIDKGIDEAQKRISDEDEESCIFMLPLHVASVVGPPIGATYSRGPRSTSRADRRVGRGVEKFRDRWGRGKSGVDGGRSQCLRVIVITREVGVPRDSHDQDSLGTSLSYLHCPLTRPKPRQAVTAVFNEHDLLRDAWTEFLIPISISSLPDSATAPAAAVVLQARSAGFHPKILPVWLVCRNFAERTVRRMISAALAAVAQPRVEVTLVGLLGDIDSLLHVEGSRNENINDIELSPRAEGNHEYCKEVLCQAFWNGALAHKLRLRRVVPCSPDHTQMLATPSSSLREIAPPCDFGAAENGRDAPFWYERDPATKFFDGQAGSESQLQDDWVRLDGVFTSEPPSIEGEQERGQVHTTDGVRKRDANRSPSPSTTVAQGHNPRETTPSPLLWVPIEGERYARRPFRFFLPASLSETAGIHQGPEGVRCPCDGDRRHFHVEENVSGDEQTARCVKTTDSAASDRALAERTTISGSLSLIFWGVVPSMENCNTACSDATEAITQETSIRSGRRPKAIKRSRRQLVAHREKVFRLIGCVRLENEDLVFQPPGKLVELQMLRKSGFYKSSAWTMAHDLTRDIHATQVTSGSVAVVMRHFDVPRGLLQNLPYPAPFLEVEVINGHGLTKASGQLSTNPYVVLTMNGEPFARTTTCRGTTHPNWISERFRVKLPPLNTRAWFLTPRDYFRELSKNATSCVLGVEVYNDADHGARGPQSHEGIDGSDALLGEGHLPVLHPESLPFFYVPVHLSAPSGLRGFRTDERCTTPAPPGGGGGAKNNAAADAGLLGIGLRILFPNSSVPVPSAFAFCAADVAEPSRLAFDGGFPTWVAQPPSRAFQNVKDEIVLRVHEAENLAPDAGTKRSINPFCVVLVDGVEVGRTQTILDSSDPMWATEFHLSDEVLSRPASLLNSTGAGRLSGQIRSLAERNFRDSDPSSGTVASVDFEVWDRVAHGQPVLVGAAKFPAGLLRALLMRDCTLPDDPLGDDSSVTAKRWRGVQQYSLELRLRPREYRQKAFAEGGGNSAPAAGLEEKIRGVLSVTAEQVKAAIEATGEVEETTAGANAGNVAGGGCCGQWEIVEGRKHYDE